IAVSNKWGTLARLKTLLENPATTVTTDEVRAYERYRDNYARFWRQYFDPIAVRLDIVGERKFALEVFILPLLDDTLYNGLKTVFGAPAAPRSLLPRYEQPAVATLALSIPDSKPRRDVVHEFAKLLASEADLIKLFPLLTGDLVFSVQDTESVLQTNFPGLIRFGETTALGRRDAEMLLFVPAAMALLTRPCDLALRVTDEAKAREILSTISSRVHHTWVNSEITSIEDENRIVYTLNFAGVMRLEIAASVEHGWLRLTNRPWTRNRIIGTEENTAAHGRLQLNPAQIKTGLTQALASARLARRSALFSNAQSLALWADTFGTDAAGAVKHQRAALGEATPLPSGETADFTSLGRSNFPPSALLPNHGTWFRQREKSTDRTDAGLFRNLRAADLWLRFEDTGLRTRIEFETGK
ncbi:MAG: hypothetical protein LBT53_02225, partial [Puniceicoccales bacterium]|nr:hypothetical protein [Puniceicoccales bacterium]